MTLTYVNEGIEVRHVSACYVCGAAGQLLYESLRDRLFGAPGEWNLKKCCNPRCELLWLDPMPVEADLHKIYENYYTHQVGDSCTEHADSGRTPSLALKPFLKVLKFGHQLLGYLTGMNSALPHARTDAAKMYLVNKKAGRLLDVGCGNGVFLNHMQSLGWNVHGVEVDSKSARITNETFDIPVYVGSLEEANYARDYFDAITLNHVIEHVYDPIGLLKGCYRNLKPGGHLVAVTPNACSTGHVRFKRHWRGLEPPRHFYIFSPLSLERIANQVGFQKVEIWTTPAKAEGMALESLGIQRNKPYVPGSLPSLSRIIKSRWFQLRAFTAHRKNPGLGEEAVLRVAK